MSAGICGKRLGLEDIFGSPSPQGPSVSKRPRRCSPSRCVGFGSGAEDGGLSLLLRMFPSIDPKVVKSALDSHGNKIDDAIENLHALCLGNGCRVDDVIRFDADVISSNVTEGSTSNTATKPAQDDNSNYSRMSQYGSSWVDLFVDEMRNASDWDDVRGCTTRLLEAFEKNVLSRAMTLKELEEIVSLKEQLDCLLRDNTVLKKGIQIQHEQNLEHEEKLKEGPALKHFISQCQDQIRKLEMDNYALRLHLQRSQDANSILGHFHRDIF